MSVPILPFFERPGVLTRFIAKVASSDDRDVCWDWAAAIGAGGYGVFKLAKGVTRQSHRIAYALQHGEPGDLLVLHSCDRPLCCNPWHMRLGKHQDNMDDKRRSSSVRAEQNVTRDGTVWGISHG